MNTTYTPNMKKVFHQAQREAERLGHEQVAGEHLLLALIQGRESVTTTILLDLNVDVGALKQAVEEVTPFGDDPSHGDEAQRIRQAAVREATKMGTPFVGTEHLLLALLGGKERIRSTLAAFNLAYGMVEREVTSRMERASERLEGVRRSLHPPGS